MRTVLAICLMLVLAVAWAWRMPSDAQVVLTAQDGRIVGVGFALAGERFDLELLPDFEGAAQLLVVSLEGGALALRAIVTDGVVYVDTASIDGPEQDADAEPLALVALTDLLDASGFARVAVGVPAAAAADDGLAAAGAGRERGAETSQSATDAAPIEHPGGGAPDGRGADRADEASDRADDMGRDRDEEDEDRNGPPSDDERPVPTPPSRP